MNHSVLHGAVPQAGNPPSERHLISRCPAATKVGFDPFPENFFHYAVIEGARPPLRHHQASFQVLPGEDGRSRLRWITDVLPASLAGPIEARTAHGIKEMKEVLELPATALGR
ncbi:hypothetical protein MXD61_18475 [Frankia sp. AgPm24]|uniref:hypothetical protein n=1 Tax=Frankia sp. AgPm24 TaxID=631128 RepID=UPI00200D28F6|nr:hypothetical protein [Frankia sp. AgPm24]MCK9923828.1 hypothetical protein [Frankia sp. AgPm24]